MALHVIIGEDDFLVREAAKRIIAGAEGLEIIDSVNSTNEEKRLADIGKALNAYLTPPFLEPRKVTWWRNVDFFPGSVKGGDREKVSEAVKEAFEALSKRFLEAPLPANQDFIISGGSLPSASRTAANLKAAGEILRFEAAKPWEVDKIAAQRAREFAETEKLEFEPSALARFVAIVGSDTGSIKNEVEKLSVYLGDRRTVKSADVDEITSEGAGKDPFFGKLDEAICLRRPAEAIAFMNQLADDGGFAVILTSMVVKILRTLVEVRSAGDDADALKEVLSGKSPTQASRYRTAAGGRTLLEWKRRHAEFMRLRERSVSASGETMNALVYAMIVRLCRGVPARR